MVDRCVIEILFCQIPVRGEFVSVNRGTLLNVPFNRVDQRDFSSTVNRSCFSASATLAHPDNGGLANRASSQIQTLMKMAVCFFPAQIYFVNFDDALEQFGVISTSLAKTLEYEPSRLLGDADLFGQLHRTDSLASRNKQIHSVNPLVKRHMRPFKDRPCADSKVQRASITAVKAVLSGSNAVFPFALGADRASGPETRFEVLSSGFNVGIQVEELKGAYRGTAHGVS